jgi:hypothetical protein
VKQATEANSCKETNNSCKHFPAARLNVPKVGIAEGIIVAPSEASHVYSVLHHPDGCSKDKLDEPTWHQQWQYQTSQNMNVYLI